MMPNSRSALAVCSPTAATLTPANARASRPYSSNFSRMARTALTEVKAIHWYRPVTRPLTARSICCGRARRLDRDGRHLLGHGAAGAQQVGDALGLLLGPRHEHPPAEQRLGLEPGQGALRGDAVADDRHRRAAATSAG